MNIYKKKSFFKFCLFTAQILFLNSFLAAETVILRTHEVVHGKITFQNALVLKIKDDTGKLLEIPKNEILKVSYRDVKDATEIKKIIEEEEGKLPPEKRKQVEAPEKRNKYKVLLMSTVVPGWGQFKTGNKLYAAIAFVGVLGAGSYASSRYTVFKKEETNYKTAVNINYILINQGIGFTAQNFGTAFIASYFLNNSSYEPFYNAQNRGNDAMKFLGLVYGAQLVHSFILGRAWEKADPNTTIGKKAAYGEWNINAYSKQASSASGLARESYYEASYMFQF